MSNPKGERCGPCKDEGFPNVLAHFMGVAANRSKDGKAQPPMCWEHHRGLRPTRMPKAKEDEPKALQKSAPLALDAIKLGIDSDKEFVEFLNVLMRDVTAGTVSPEQAKTVCAVADRIIKIAELRLKLEMSKPR
jgi:hypothetical protein